MLKKVASETQMTLILKGPLLDRLREYHEHAGLPGKAQDTAKDLIALALDQPFLWSRLLQITRRRAWRQTGWTAINELRASFESATKTHEMALEGADVEIDLEAESKGDSR